MLLKRKTNISAYTALAAALILLATEVFAGHHGENQADIVDTAVSAGSFNTLETVTTANASDGAIRVADAVILPN